MSKPADKPEVVQLPAETPVAVPASQRRAAAQRVREARDRLTSTSGTRPAFDRELLRQYAQTRVSASFVVMLLVVATGLLFGFWMRPVSAAAWTCSMLCIHAAIIRYCDRFLAEPPTLTTTRKWRTRFVLLDLLYGLSWTAVLIHPAGLDAVSNTLMMFLMLLVIAVSSMLAASLCDSRDYGAIKGRADFDDVPIFHPSAVDKETVGCDWGNRHFRHCCLRDADSDFDYRPGLVVAFSGRAKSSTPGTQRFTG